MIVLLTADLYLVEWTPIDRPPAPGDAVETDQGSKIVMRLLGDDGDDRGVPRWATILRATLQPTPAPVPSPVP